MRRGPVADGWAGSLFPEPIDQVKVPSDRCVCHQDCPQYETCETEALDKNSKVYYLLRCVKGKFPACVNCMCMACDRYDECKDGETDLRGGVRYRLCNRPISITGCPDYSGPVSWKSEAACKKCDHVCDLRKEWVWAPRVRCDLNPIEPTKKPTEEPSVVQLDGKPTVEHPTLIRYGHETWGRYELEGRLVEEFISTDKPVRKESEFAADMVAVDAARKAAGDLPLARSFIEKGARGIRVYEDPALQEGGTLCCHLVVSKQNGGLCTGCSDQRGTPCSYSRPAEHTSPEPAVVPAKPAKAKKPATPALHRGDRVKFRDDLAPGGVGFGYVTGISHGGPRDLSIHVTWAEYGKKAAMVKDRSCQLMSPDQLELDPLDKWQLANCGKHHSCRDDCAGLRSGALCPWLIGLDFLKSCVRQGDMPADLLDDRAKDDAEAKVARSTKAKKTEPTSESPKPVKAKKQPKLTRADYDNNPLPGSNADICSHCDCETCGLNQAHLNYTDKEWAHCPPCGCDQCLGKDELQPTTLCGRKAALTVDVLGNTESQLPAEQQHLVTLQRYVRQFCGECKCLTCGRAYQNCAMNGDEPYHICSICTLEHAHHHKPYPAIIKDCEHWIDKATFPADIYAPGQGPCPETACELRYNGEGGPCLCQSCKHGTPDCDSTCGVPGYPMETGQYACEWYAPKVATPDGPTPELDELAAELDVQMMKKRQTAELALPEALRPKHGPKYWDVPDLVKVGDLVTLRLFPKPRHPLRRRMSEGDQYVPRAGVSPIRIK